LERLLRSQVESPLTPNVSRFAPHVSVERR
jgi:hypothetical protein